VDAVGVFKPLYDGTFGSKTANGVNGHTETNGTNGVNGHLNGSKPSKKGVDALTIASRVISDQRWSTIDFDELEIFRNLMAVTQSPDHLAAIVEHAKGWEVYTSNEAELEKKIEELQWMAVLMFAAPKPEGDGPKADFFLSVCIFLFVTIYFIDYFDYEQDALRHILSVPPNLHEVSLPRLSSQFLTLLAAHSPLLVCLSRMPTS
jgi:hypothetical protein